MAEGPTYDGSTGAEDEAAAMKQRQQQVLSQVQALKSEGKEDSITAEGLTSAMNRIEEQRKSDYRYNSSEMALFLERASQKGLIGAAQEPATGETGESKSYKLNPDGPSRAPSAAPSSTVPVNVGAQSAVVAAGAAEVIAANVSQPTGKQVQTRGEKIERYIAHANGSEQPPSRGIALVPPNTVDLTSVSLKDGSDNDPREEVIGVPNFVIVDKPAPAAGGGGQQPPGSTPSNGTGVTPSPPTGIQLVRPSALAIPEDIVINSPLKNGGLNDPEEVSEAKARAKDREQNLGNPEPQGSNGWADKAMMAAAALPAISRGLGRLRDHYDGIKHSLPSFGSQRSSSGLLYGDHLPHVHGHFTEMGILHHTKNKMVAQLPNSSTKTTFTHTGFHMKGKMVTDRDYRAVLGTGLAKFKKYTYGGSDSKHALFLKAHCIVMNVPFETRCKIDDKKLAGKVMQLRQAGYGPVEIPQEAIPTATQGGPVHTARSGFFQKLVS